VTSGLDVGLEFDRPDRTYRPGEEITGRVLLRSSVELNRVEVRIALNWRTSGKGDVEQGDEPLAIDVAMDERVEPDALRAFPFTLPAPDGPPTFHGKLLNVDWILEAFVHSTRGSADAQEDVVLAGARTTILEGKPHGKVRSRALAAVPGPESLTATAFVAGAAALGLSIGVMGGEGAMCFCGFPGFALALCALAMVPGALAVKRLGRVELEVPQEVAPGEGLTVALRIRPPKRVALNAITVTLRGEESVTAGSGSDKKVEQHEVYRTFVTLSQATIVEPNGFAGEVELQLPPDALPSFATTKNSIRWTLSVNIDIPSWPDWNVKLPIIVLPSGTVAVATKRRSIAIQPKQRCPFCRDAIAGAEPTPIVSCAGCETVLHEDCWTELGRCPTPGCGRERPRIRARGT
jgi:hypothetical protein